MNQQIIQLGTDQIVPGDNDRTVFDPKALESLAENIRQHGLIQPITVRPIDATDLYQIVAGERRFRACSLLGWETIPCIIRDLTDSESSAIMLQENMARKDLDPIDEALAYQKRIEAYGWTVSQVAQVAGVSDVRVQFRLKLLRLRPDLQGLVRQGSLALGYAQILSDGNLDSARQMLAISALRDNRSPTPAWFRRTVNELFTQQAQCHLFDLPMFGADLASSLPPAAPPEPPHPATTTPPRKGRSARQILDHQAAFWTQAAEAWGELGKPFKRQECQAAAQALQLALANL